MNGDDPSVFSKDTPVARSDHVCYECRRTIPAGTKYHKFKGCWDGKFSHYKTCTDCEELRHELKYENELAPFGSLEEWASEACVLFPSQREAP